MRLSFNDFYRFSKETKEENHYEERSESRFVNTQNKIRHKKKVKECLEDALNLPLHYEKNKK